jgi:putative tryptophan/tyrosine transport system substrate-binding protein
MAGKWMNLLKECQPLMRRAAIMFNPDTAAGGVANILASFEAAARSVGVDPMTVHVRNEADIDAAIIALGREHAGLVMVPDAFLFVRRGTIIASASRNKVPTVFDALTFAREGGLISYGPSFSDIFRRAAGYVDRILRGDKPVDLPVAVPTKFELLVNLRTAKVLGLTIPETLLATADEVIQ